MKVCSYLMLISCNRSLLLRYVTIMFFSKIRIKHVRFKKAVDFSKLILKVKIIIYSIKSIKYA